MKIQLLNIRLFDLIQELALTILIISILLFNGDLKGQSIKLSGYTYESGNRGYLSGVNISVKSNSTGEQIYRDVSDKDGYFQFELNKANYTIEFSKEVFHKEIKLINTKDGEKQFLKIELKRKPGYLFEVTIAEKRDSPNHKVDAIKGAYIEVYNNTKEKEVLSLKNHEEPHFEVNFEKGNHYTILLRKTGYIAKQMEAYVNVEGCILCFEGVGKVTPGVSDNLTEGGEFGVLLANVEMDRLYEGKTLVINNLYYDLDKYFLKNEGKKELDKVIKLMKYNPNLSLELGSHTDSRGTDEYNMRLSKNRAETAVKYIRQKGGVSKDKITFKGYGETQLVNNCTNGVACEEEEHAKNRRTEIKIVGIETIDQYIPLSKIKNNERLERLIIELQNQEQVIVKEGEKLEEKLKNTFLKDSIELLKQDENNDKTNQQSEPEAIKDVMEEQIEAKEKIIFEATDSIEETNDSFVIEELEIRNTDVENENEIQETLIGAEVRNETSKINNSKIGNEIITYHLVVKYAYGPISESDAIFNLFEEVKYYVTQDGFFIYYIGEYKTKPEARLKLDELETQYPSMYVIKMKDGKKVE